MNSAFERIMTVERLVHQKIVATAGRNGWKFKVEETERAENQEPVEA